MDEGPSGREIGADDAVSRCCIQGVLLGPLPGTRAVPALPVFDPPGDPVLDAGLEGVRVLRDPRSTRILGESRRP